METEIIQEKISKLKENKAVCCIVEVGAFKKQVANDVDLFVFLLDDGEFLREVVNIKGIIFDISYIPINVLEIGMKQKWSFLMTACQTFEIIYQNGEAFKVIELLKIISSLAPEPLSIDEIKYLRFKLNEDYDALRSRLLEKNNALFLMNHLFYKCLNTYFKLHNKWVPKDKKMLQELKKIDIEFYVLCQTFMEEINIEMKSIILKQVLNDLLNPFGGLLNFWEKGKFPLK